MTSAKGWTSLFKPNFPLKEPLIDLRNETQNPMSSSSLKARRGEIDQCENAFREREIQRSTTFQSRNADRNELPHYSNPLGRAPYLTLGKDECAERNNSPRHHSSTRSVTFKIEKEKDESPQSSKARRLCRQQSRGECNDCHHDRIQQRIVAPVGSFQRYTLQQTNKPKHEIWIEELDKKPQCEALSTRSCDGVSGLLARRTLGREKRWCRSSSRRNRTQGEALSSLPPVHVERAVPPLIRCLSASPRVVQSPSGYLPATAPCMPTISRQPHFNRSHTIPEWTVPTVGPRIQMKPPLSPSKNQIARSDLLSAQQPPIPPPWVHAIRSPPSFHTNGRSVSPSSSCFERRPHSASPARFVLDRDKQSSLHASFPEKCSSVEINPRTISQTGTTATLPKECHNIIYQSDRSNKGYVPLCSNVITKQQVQANKAADTDKAKTGIIHWVSKGKAKPPCHLKIANNQSKFPLALSPLADRRPFPRTKAENSSPEHTPCSTTRFAELPIDVTFRPLQSAACRDSLVCQGAAARASLFDSVQGKSPRLIETRKDVPLLEERQRTCPLEDTPKAWQTLSPPARPEGNCVKKALCVGVGYLGKLCELRGSVTDSLEMQKVLKRSPFNFNVKLLADNCVAGVGTSHLVERPTKKNILLGLEWLLGHCSSGDILVWYFSGCSARVSDMDLPGFGEDALVPEDFAETSLSQRDVSEPTLVYSDEVHILLEKHSKPGVQLITIMDCSSAATLIPTGPAIVSAAEQKWQLRLEKPRILTRQSRENLWIKWADSKVTEKRLWEPFVSGFFRRSKFKGYHFDPLKIAAIARARVSPCPAIFTFEASTGQQQAYEAVVDGKPRGLLTLCLLRAFDSLDVKEATVLSVFEAACDHFKNIKLSGPSELSFIEQNFVLGFTQAHHPGNFRFLSRDSPLPAASELSQNPSWALTPSVSLKSTLHDINLPSISDSSVTINLLAIYLCSVNDITVKDIAETNCYYISVGFTTMKEDGTPIVIPPQISLINDACSTRKVASLEVSDPLFEECNFENEKLLLRHETPALQRCLHFNLWKTSSEFDELVGVLLVNISDSKLQTPQPWLMRSLDRRPVATITFFVSSSKTQQMFSSKSSVPPLPLD